MQPLIRVKLTCVSLALMTSLASAANVSFVSKQRISNSEKYQYIYKYACINGAKGEMTVESADDRAANKLAEKKGVIVCEE